MQVSWNFELRGVPIASNVAAFSLSVQDSFVRKQGNQARQCVGSLVTSSQLRNPNKGEKFSKDSPLEGLVVHDAGYGPSTA